MLINIFVFPVNYRNINLIPLYDCVYQKLMYMLENSHIFHMTTKLIVHVYEIYNYNV